MNRDDLGRLIAVSGEDIDEMPWESDPTDVGVYRKTLWQSGNVVLGLMRVDEGFENPEHVHHAAHHHILILHGQCTILGKRLGPGSYVYIPPTVPHGVTDVGPGECTFFYTYRPMERVAPGSPLDSEHGGVV
ncbi:MAG TPA: cupin domain-containing protein [Actinomycetota bacterium]|nr:cupin domain-containing protein [Actinomycetota bacterium]